MADFESALTAATIRQLCRHLAARVALAACRKCLAYMNSRFARQRKPSFAARRSFKNIFPAREKRKPRLFLVTTSPRSAILLLQLPDVLLLGSHRFTNAWQARLLGGIWRHLAANGVRADTHAFAGMLNAESFFINHLDNLQLKPKIKIASSPCNTDIL